MTSKCLPLRSKGRQMSILIVQATLTWGSLKHYLILNEGLLSFCMCRCLATLHAISYLYVVELAWPLLGFGICTCNSLAASSSEGLRDILAEPCTCACFPTTFASHAMKSEFEMSTSRRSEGHVL